MDVKMSDTVKALEQNIQEIPGLPFVLFILPAPSMITEHYRKLRETEVKDSRVLSQNLHVMKTAQLVAMHTEVQKVLFSTIGVCGELVEWSGTLYGLCVWLYRNNYLY